MSSLGINNTIVPTIVTPNPTSIPKMPKSNPYASTLYSSLVKYTYIKEDGVITIYETKKSNDGSPELIPKYHIKTPTSSDPNVCIQDYYNNIQIYWNAFPRLNEVTTTTNNDTTTTTTTITPLPNNSVSKHQYLGDNLNVQDHRFSNLSTTSFDSVSSNGSAYTFNSSLSTLSLNGINNYGIDGINKLIKPTSTWEISNLSTPSTLIKYEKLLGGYVVSWNGRMFLWKIGVNNVTVVGPKKKNRTSFVSSYSSRKNTNVFSNGSLVPENDGEKQSELYCVEGLSGLGARVAEFEKGTNVLHINVSNKILDTDSYNSTGKSNSKEEELLTSFESFILITGLIAKNSAKKLSKKHQENPNDKYTEPHLFNYSPFFMFCGFCT